MTQLNSIRLWLEPPTHSRHGLLVEREGDVGTAVVLVTGAGAAFGGRRRRVGAPALPEPQAGSHEAVALSDGDTALARRTPASTFGAQLARLRATPHL